MSTNSKNRSPKGEEEDSLTQDTSLPTTGGQETSVVDKEVEQVANKETEVIPKDEIALKKAQEAVDEDTPEPRKAQVAVAEDIPEPKKAQEAVAEDIPEPKKAQEAVAEDIPGPKKAVSDEAVKEDLEEPIQVPKDEVALKKAEESTPKDEVASKKAHDTEQAEKSTPKDEVALKKAHDTEQAEESTPKDEVALKKAHDTEQAEESTLKDEVALKKAHDTEKAEVSTPKATPEPKETEEADKIPEVGTDSKVTFDPEEPQVMTPEATSSAAKVTSTEKPAEEVAKGNSQPTEDEIKTKSQANVVALEAIKLDSKTTTEEAKEMTMPDSATFDKANEVNSSAPDSKPSVPQTKEAPEESKPATESKPRSAEEVDFDELGMTEQEALEYLKEEEAAKKAAAGSGPPKIQVYGSSVSGSYKIKKAQNKILDTLERFGIEYEFMDLAADDEAKLYIKRKNPNSTAIPQIYINGEFSMEFAEFEELLEYDELFDALGVEPDF